MNVSMFSVQNEIDCGATVPSCTIALILLAHNIKQDQSYQRRCIFCLLHLFSLFLLDARIRKHLWNRLKNHRELWNILIRLLLFVKFIDEYAHHAWNPWKSELKERSSTPNTKFDIVTLPSRHRHLIVRHYRAELLGNTAVKDVFNYSSQMQKTGGYNHVYF